MKIGIAGLGLIGGSMAKAYKFYTDNKVLGFDKDEAAFKRAVLVGAVDDRLSKDTIGECDVIIVALYPKASVEYVMENAPYIKKGATVIDCCGVKDYVCVSLFEVAEKYGFDFFGGHPMAGTQFSGFKAAKENLFAGASMIIVPKDTDDIYKLDYVKSLFTCIGFKNITVTDSKTHDKMIAYTSQLAHVVSSAYVKSPVSDVHKGFSAGSFKDLTRVAKLNEEMWTELFMENAQFLTDEIDRMAEELKKYSDAIKTKDKEKLYNLLKEGSIAKEKSL